jgi:hypothetical protein
MVSDACVDLSKVDKTSRSFREPVERDSAEDVLQNCQQEFSSRTHRATQKGEACSVSRTQVAFILSVAIFGKINPDSDELATTSQIVNFSQKLGQKMPVHMPF